MRILLADDHEILRKGLIQILASKIPGATFGETGNAVETIARLHQESWDVLILDISMPGRNGFEVLEDARRAFPQLPVIVLSSTPEDQLGVRAIRSGAMGYLNKQVAAEQLVEAVRKAMAGNRFVSAALAERLIAAMQRDDDRPRHLTLSDRELQVMKMSAGGRSVKEIAAELSVSGKTISTFRGRLFDKLGVRNDAELANYVRDHGLI